MTIPRAPEGAGAAGKRLWRAVLDDFELAEHEMVLLRQAVRVADLCDQLQAVVEAEGPLLRVDGQPRTHPAVVELRQQRIVLARLVVALRVPLGRPGARGAGHRTGPAAAPRHPRVLRPPRWRGGVRRRRQPPLPWPPGLARFAEAAWSQPEDQDDDATPTQQAVWRWIHAHRRWRAARAEWLQANGLQWLDLWIEDVRAEHRKRASLWAAS